MCSDVLESVLNHQVQVPLFEAFKFKCIDVRFSPMENFINYATSTACKVAFTHKVHILQANPLVSKMSQGRLGQHSHMCTLCQASINLIFINC